MTKGASRLSNHSGAVEDRVRQRGNAVNHRHGRAELNGSGQNSQPAIARWVAPYRVGFIPALKGGAFSLNFSNRLRGDERERELAAVIIENDDQVEVRRDAAGQPEEGGADAGRVPTGRAREAPGGE